MRILVTGANGYCGRGLIDIFNREGHEVFGMSRTPIKFLSPEKQLIADIGCGPINLPSLDVVVHTAAAHLGSSPKPTPEAYIKANLVGLTNLADACRSSTVQHFFNFSTISLYGEIREAVLTEESPMRSPCIYGSSKYLGEKILEEYVDSFSVTNLRLPGIIGKTVSRPWLWHCIDNIQNSREVRIYNEDSRFNNLVDISMISSFISSTLLRGIEGAGAVNLAAKSPMILRDLIEYLKDRLNSSSQIRSEKTDKISFVISTDKAQDMYRFEATSTQETVDRYIDSLSMVPH